jgi:ubiquinone/menaquinone biosynthesis C-methylase UbiE
MGSSEDAKQAVQQQFSRTAAQYVTSAGHAKGDDLPLLVEWLTPSSDWVVLDAATGGGHVAKVVAPHVQRVYATELTKTMLETARMHLQSECRNVEFILADAENLPFLDATFDAVTCRIAPHHFPQPRLFIQEVARVLKPGGKFLMIDNVSPENEAFAHFLNRLETIRDSSHVRCPAISEWKSWISHAKLTVQQSRQRRKTFAFDAWARRMATSDSHVRDIEDFILGAAGDVQAHFGVEILDSHVATLQVDEWMVLCEKHMHST